MAEDTSASVISFRAPQKKDKTAAARAKAYRERKKRKAKPVVVDGPSSEALLSSELLPVNSVVDAAPVTPIPPVTAASRVVTPPFAQENSAPSRHNAASILLVSAGLALGAVGIAINGWFARSLGATELAGWLFLAIGVAADLVALAMPSCASAQWHGRRWATAMAGWALWLVTFAYALIAGIGFAAVNISDVALARASRVTTAVSIAQAALSDAMAARDRECRGGVGRFCREREAAVTERRQILDAEMASVGRVADPQTEAAIRLVAWSTRGGLRPAPEDFAMVRLILLALLPQVGGILMMVGCNSRPTLSRKNLAGAKPLARRNSECS
ncbi:hypothetical protein [Bradyrhizobium guangzhouense]|uniref:hypothetical protein n=1 Tax=Bradyrhizobium guangzhouense TaxID=1325095 RepID=UPI0019D6C1F6|nr:hypothetical protein [Bradyrhizobium guangzhouense]